MGEQTGASAPKTDRRRHRRLPQVCRETGHLWRVEGDIEACARRNCDEQRELVPSVRSPR